MKIVIYLILIFLLKYVTSENINSNIYFKKFIYNSTKFNYNDINNLIVFG